MKQPVYNPETEAAFAKYRDAVARYNVLFVNYNTRTRAVSAEMAQAEMERRRAFENYLKALRAERIGR